MYITFLWRETYIMSNKADRPEVTAATRKKSLARKNPVMRAIRAKHDPTYISVIS